MSLFETAIEHLPYVTATAGYAGGVVGAMAAQNRRAEQGAIVENWSPGVFDITEHPRLISRIGMGATAGVALVSMAVGLANGLAWEEGPDIQTIPAKLNIVIDHSGATAVGENPAVEQIDGFVLQFLDENIETRPLVASGGESRERELEEVVENRPFGDAPLEAATQLAMDESASLHSQSTSEEDQRTTGTLVVTNGNPIGDVHTVIKRAKEEGEPIFIVNVEASVEDQAVGEGLQAIAKESGGQYWDIDAATTEEASQKISAAIVDARTESDSNPVNLRNRVLTGLSIALIPLAYRQTKREPFSPKGLPKEARS